MTTTATLTPTPQSPTAQRPAPRSVSCAACSMRRFCPPRSRPTILRIAPKNETIAAPALSPLVRHCDGRVRALAATPSPRGPCRQPPQRRPRSITRSPSPRPPLRRPPPPRLLPPSLCRRISSRRRRPHQTCPRAHASVAAARFSTLTVGPAPRRPPLWWRPEGRRLRGRARHRPRHTASAPEDARPRGRRWGGRCCRAQGLTVRRREDAGVSFTLHSAQPRATALSDGRWRCRRPRERGFLRGRRQCHRSRPHRLTVRAPPLVWRAGPDPRPATQALSVLVTLRHTMYGGAKRLARERCAARRAVLRWAM